MNPSSSTQKQTSTSAKILYRPIGIGAGLLAGLITGKIVEQVWKRASAGSDADPPGPLQSEYPIGEILLASALQGAVFGVVKTLVNRGGAHGFEKVTGEWPGD